MATIYVKEEEHIEISIKRFRKEVEKENILRELKERQYHIKPATKRKIESAKLEKRIKRKEKKRKYFQYL